MAHRCVDCHKDASIEFLQQWFCWEDYSTRLKVYRYTGKDSAPLVATSCANIDGADRQYELKF